MTFAKYIYFLLLIFLITSYSLGQDGTFDLSSATDNGATVTETVSTVLLTISNSNNAVDLGTLGGYSELSGNMAYSSTRVTSTTLTFSDQVNISTISCGDALLDGDKTWRFIPNVGSEVTEIVDDFGQTVILDFVGVTSITITCDDFLDPGMIVDNITLDSSLPIELSLFSAELVNSSVELNWETASEVNNYGFEIERAILNSQLSIFNWTRIGFVQGHGTTNSPKNYEFTDYELPNSDKVCYRLKQIDNDGLYAYSKIVTVDLTAITSVDEELNYKFTLNQNYPNPFNPSTTISFTVPSVIANGLKQSLNTTLKVYDILGREVATLVNQKLQPGNHQVQFDASSLSSGVYLYILKSNKFIQTKKLLLMK